MIKFKPGTLQEKKAFELINVKVFQLWGEVANETGCDYTAFVRGLMNATEDFSNWLLDSSSEVQS